MSASNGATLVSKYHPRSGFRPWFKAIRINVMKSPLAEGDRISVILGDKSQGSAGWRVQSLREPAFEVRVQADPFGAVVYSDVADAKQIRIVPGEPALWKLMLPTLVGVGEPFRLSVRRKTAAATRRRTRTDAFVLRQPHRLPACPSGST
ncbi:MAG: hypothetical protein ACYCSR_16170 [Thiomonas sp.]|uniref:Uncharacterized protein n=1 Tax=mine drainage metagenome TaxID=410659 RepID=E6PRB7_9ZZZZ